ncbi:MAG: carbohydrate kinase family protein [Candidatus Yonathbacteria bacterium]|nr:carbohydrate kinase family protein [Candidatus Yonathbacteria bacterium]NTW47749.1 carbohydrate kinase family protein [Candidatus Yonathbacteria bacterium]
MIPYTHMFGIPTSSRTDIDFLAIGDIVTDAFIRINHASVLYDRDGDAQICLENGAKIPYESVTVLPAVGNSPNATVSATRLGLSAALVTDLGDDAYGTDTFATLRKNRIDTRFVRTHKGLQSNYHYVLWHKADRTILIKHEEYPYTLPDIGTPTWVYLSSLGEQSLPYHDTIASHLSAHPDIKLAFQPGTFQIKLGYERLKVFYERAEVFFCNIEEAQLILSLPSADGPTLAVAMREHGPRIALITDGPKGAYMATENGVWYMPIYPDPQQPLERTGAGDSFASTFTSFLALGMTPEEALVRAPINSMSVVQHVGAQEGLLSREELERYLTNCPENYTPQKLS